MGENGMKLALTAVTLLSALALGSGFAQADNGYIFRYKAELVGTPSPENPGEDDDDIGDGVCQVGESGSEDCNGVCEDGEEGSPDCTIAEEPGDDELLIDTVDGTADYDLEDKGIDPLAPLPEFAIVPSESGRNVNSDGIAYQCFKLSGGWHNYSFAPRGHFEPARDWIESFDIVMKSELGSPMTAPNGFEAFNDWRFAPPFDEDSYSNGVTSETDACIRIKVKPGVKSTKSATIEMLVMDYPPSLVSDGKVSWNDSAENYIWIPVTFKPDCIGGCYPDAPPLVVSSVGGSADLRSLQYMGFGWGYAPGPGFDATPSSVTISGGIPPYEVDISSDAFAEYRTKPVGAGCMLKFDSYAIPAEFYPDDEDEQLTTEVTVTDAAGQVSNQVIHHSISGLNNGRGKAWGGGIFDVLSPDDDCNYMPFSVSQDYGNTLELEAGDSTDLGILIEGGDGPYVVTAVNLPPELELKPRWGGGWLVANVPGSWTGSNAVRIKVADASGNEEFLDYDVTVTAKPSGYAAFGSNSRGAFGVSSSSTSGETKPYGFNMEGYDFLSAGSDYTCGISGGTLSCWGENYYGQTGVPHSATPSYPTELAGSGWTSIDTGTGGHACGVRSGTLYCWGSGSDGGLGNGSTSDTNVPQPVSLAGANWTSYSVGGFNNCGVSNGGLYCWGNGYNNLLGLGSDTASKSVPTRVGVDSDWVSVSASGSHACGIRSSGQLYCWGNNSGGATGQGVSSSTTSTPTLVNADNVLNADWTQVLTGNGFTCGLKDDVAYCWGNNASGQLGQGGLASTSKPTVSTGSGWTMLDVGMDHVCGLKGTEAYCWGDNTSGKTAQGTIYGETLVPTKVSPDRWDEEYVWTFISVGERHTVGLTN